MLAYVFWHRPARGVDGPAYERALERFHRSLAARPPDGFAASVCYRAPELPWLDGGGSGYEDWYLIENWTALGVLNEAAVSRGHRTAHEAAASHAGPGSGGVFRLLEGEPDFAAVRVAVWVVPARGTHRDEVAALLADGMDGEHGGLWQRQLVLGPAPEFCLLAPEVPAGVRPTRLPEGWRATIAERDGLGPAP